MENKQDQVSLIDLAADFVKTLNLAIPSFELKNNSELEQLQKLKKRIGEIMMKLEKSEENASLLLDQLENPIHECKDVVYIRKDGNLKAVISRDIIKPVVKPVNKLEIQCNCKVQIETKFKGIQGYFIVETEKNLRELDSTLETVIVGVFDHKYRSYEPYTCIIAVYVPDGFIYIIDAIKFRNLIPDLKLLKCDIKKVFVSQYDVEKITRDFGSIGCYCNYNLPESEIFIDWRIRPITEVFVGVIGDTMAKTAEKLNTGISTDVFFPSQKNSISEFLNNFQIDDMNAKTVEDLFKLREYLAKLNNEGVQYVMTDSQLINLATNLPSSLEEFEVLFERMSPIVRLHVDDFLLIMNRKNKIFSLEQLKSKNPDANFDVSSNQLNSCLASERSERFYKNNSEESDLEISCESV